ncbi:hypothetical protein [Sphingomonas sp.]|nr:hypothetical protein [Sphingomonas sp.]
MGEFTFGYSTGLTFTGRFGAHPQIEARPQFAAAIRPVADQ